MTKSSTEWLTSPEAPERIAGLLGGEQSGIRITAPDPLGDSNHQLKVRTGLGFGSGVLVYDDPPRPALDDDLRACVEEMLGLPAGTLRRPQVASPVPSAGCGGLPMIAPSDWQDQPVPARQWFVPGMIPARNVTLLSGDGGLGKSLLALQLGVASALNKPMLDLTPAPGRVLYVGAEDEADEFQRRMADILRHMGADFAALDNFRLVSLADRDALLAAPDRTGTLLPTPLFAELADKIDDFKPRFIVLDTCADLFGGDEIRRAQVRQFVAMLRQLAMTADCAILLLAHPSVAGMQSGAGTSGSTAWNNSVRSRLYLDTPPVEKGDIPDPDLRRLSMKKNNYGGRSDDMLLRWHQGAFVLDNAITRADVSGLLNSHADGVFVSVLSKLNRQGQKPSPSKHGGSYAPKMIYRHPDCAGLALAQLERALQRLLDAGTVKIIEEGPPSKPRPRLVVAAEDFGGIRETAAFRVASESSGLPVTH